MKNVILAIPRFVVKNKNIFIEIICFLFILLFVYAAVSKLLDYGESRAQLGQSPMLAPFAGWIAWGVPTAEILISVLLLTSRFRLLALYACFTLMFLFTAYIVTILNFSDHVPCSCGGVLEKLGWTEHLIFNIGFILLAFIGILLSSPPEQKDKISHNQHIVTS